MSTSAIAANRIAQSIDVLVQQMPRMPRDGFPLSAEDLDRAEQVSRIVANIGSALPGLTAVRIGYQTHPERG